jgi:hypothetical protein
MHYCMHAIMITGLLRVGASGPGAAAAARGAPARGVRGLRSFPLRALAFAGTGGAVAAAGSWKLGRKLPGSGLWARIARPGLLTLQPPWGQQQQRWRPGKQARGRHAHVALGKKNLAAFDITLEPRRPFSLGMQHACLSAAAAPASPATPLAAAASGPVEKFRKDYAPLPWSVDRVNLHLNLLDGASDADRATVVTGHLQIHPSATASGAGAANDLVLDCEDLVVESVAVDGKAVAFTHAGDKLTLPASSLPSSQDPTSSAGFTLTTVVRLAPAANLQLSGLYKSSGVFCTQCEAEGFRRITP